MKGNAAMPGNDGDTGDTGSPSSSSRSFIQNPLPLLLALAALATLAAAIALWLTGGSQADEVGIVLPAQPGEAPAELKVYLSGAVRAPGVYIMTEGDRVIDAVEAAGGPTEDAALDAVNLAGRLKDEDHWHVPAVGEAAGHTPSGPPAGAITLDLNLATAEQLTGLPGIGDAKAASIVSHREEMGGFDSVEDLREVHGIGDAIVEGIRDLVTVR